MPTLNDTEKSLNKLQEIIDMYYKDKNVCLWFRPHPLLLQTLKVTFAYRPLAFAPKDLSKLSKYELLLTTFGVLEIP